MGIKLFASDKNLIIDKIFVKFGRNINKFCVDLVGVEVSLLNIKFDKFINLVHPKIALLR